MDLSIIIYSHTDFKSILQIQTDYCCNYNFNLILFINNNNEDMDSIYKHYKKIIFYDDNLTYFQKLHNCISNLDSDYFIFTHDNDILINYEENKIMELYNILKSNNLDRLELKAFNINFNGDCYEPINSKSENIKANLFLNKNPNTFPYNVNPSIWKKKSFLDLLNTFPSKGYRDGEEYEVQSFFCKKFKTLCLKTEDLLQCGYYTCFNFYKYIHITHDRKLLTIIDGKNSQNQSCKDIIEDYKLIMEKYNPKI